MAVTVQYQKPFVNGALDDHHAEADYLEVVDGHLIVKKMAQTRTLTVAVYAPGKWTKAEVVAE